MATRLELEQAIKGLDAQRSLLGDAVVETALAPLRQQLATRIGAEAQTRRRSVTVLFADVAGFTAMSEALDAEEVRDLMNSVWRLLDAAITGHSGIVDKHIGDAVMALFGAEVAREDDPERAILAALDMQACLRDVVGELGAAAGGLGMRIGIHSGPVILGEVGSAGEFTAMGDTVNLASRLESAASVGGILVSHDTYRHVRGVFEVRVLDPIAVKGKAQPVQVYAVDRAKARAFRKVARGVEGIETPLVGRDAELLALQAAMRDVMETGEARFVTLVGEAGIGKSRLLWAFDDWMELMPEDIRLFRGRVTGETGVHAYGLIRDLFSFRFQMQESDPGEVARDKLVSGVKEMMGDDSEEAAHFMGHLIGLDFRQSPYLRGILDDPRQIRGRAFHAITQLFEAVGRQMPVVVFLEDMHWADGGSLDLIEHLMERCQAMPLLVICLARPTLFERRSAWGEGAGDHGTRIDLAPLTDGYSARLVDAILSRCKEIPAALRDRVVGAAEGNPYYVEELLKMLMEQGVIERGETEWTVQEDRLGDLAVPPTLTAVLQARLDALSPAERGVLQRASVVGRIFWQAAVADLDPSMPDEALVQALAGLRRRELIFPRLDPAFAGTAEHSFKHAILYDVTYETVLLKHRRVWHGQVARWLIDQAGDAAPAWAARIAEHLERAGQDVAAGEWHARAGHRARDAYAPIEAIAHYERARALLPEDAAHAPLRVPVCEGLALMLWRQARSAKAVEAASTMGAAARAAGDGAAESRALSWRSGFKMRLGGLRPALADAEEAAALARESGAGPEFARALAQQAWARYCLGEPDAALTLGEAALEASRGVGDDAAAARSLQVMGAVHYSVGRFQAAAGCHQRALALFEQMGNRQGAASLRISLGDAARLRGDPQEAARQTEAAARACREIGDRESEATALNNLGGARVDLGEHARAEAILRDVIDRVAPDWWALPETRRFLAEACLGQGRLQAARAEAETAVALAGATGSPELLGPIWRVLGEVAAALGAPVTANGQPHDAAACFAESLRVLTETNQDPERARTLRAQAQGDTAQAAALLREARALFERLDMPHELQRTPLPPGAN